MAAAEDWTGRRNRRETPARSCGEGWRTPLRFHNCPRQGFAEPRTRNYDGKVYLRNAPA